jgi:hypothetical protein
MTRTTHYRDVTLSRVKTDPYGINTITRTMTGKKLMRLMGECIAAGGDAQMDVRYYDDNGGEIMDLTLTWPEGA